MNTTGRNPRGAKRFNGRPTSMYQLMLWATTDLLPCYCRQPNAECRRFAKVQQSFGCPRDSNVERHHNLVEIPIPAGLSFDSIGLGQNSYSHPPIREADPL